MLLLKKFSSINAKEKESSLSYIENLTISYSAKIVFDVKGAGILLLWCNDCFAIIINCWLFSITEKSSFTDKLFSPKKGYTKVLGTADVTSLVLNW